MEFEELRRIYYGLVNWEENVLFWWLVSPLIAVVVISMASGFLFAREMNNCGLGLGVMRSYEEGAFW